MNDDDLRALVRAAIQRHMAADPSAHARPVPPVPAAPAISISFGQYRLDRAADDTMCIIEPAVSCNHCGFCKCHGH